MLNKIDNLYINNNRPNTAPVSRKDYKTLLSKRLGYNSDLFLITKIDTLYFNKNTSPPPAPKYSNNNENIFII